MSHGDYIRVAISMASQCLFQNLSINVYVFQKKNLLVDKLGLSFVHVVYVFWIKWFDMMPSFLYISVALLLHKGQIENIIQIYWSLCIA
jgi:hypothetical protein